jgi:hypothetical protein
MRDLSNLQERAKEAPPDPGLLVDVLEALEAGRAPHPHAIEELEHLLNGMAFVARELRRRRAVRRVEVLLDFGDYPSVRSVARKVGLEVGAAAETVRSWVAEAGGIHPPLR